MTKGISKNVPHTYIQDGIRYYAFQKACETRRVADDSASRITAYHFFIFDEDGYCFFQILQTTQAFINSIGNGILKQRTVLEADDLAWSRRPIQESDTWIDGSADRGYAVEIIREALGLNLEYFTAIMNTDMVREKEEGNYEKTESETPR